MSLKRCCGIRKSQSPQFLVELVMVLERAKMICAYCAVPRQESFRWHAVDRELLVSGAGLPPSFISFMAIRCAPREVTLTQHMPQRGRLGRLAALLFLVARRPSAQRCCLPRSPPARSRLSSVACVLRRAQRILQGSSKTSWFSVRKKSVRVLAGSLVGPRPAAVEDLDGRRRPRKRTAALG